MGLVLTGNSGCGCLTLIRVIDDVMVGAIITEYSSHDPNAEDYAPIITEDGVYYLVPEDYDSEMSVPKKISEFADIDIADLLLDADNIRVTLVRSGVPDNVANINGTFSDLIGAILSTTNFDIEVTADNLSNNGKTITDSRLIRDIGIINDGQQAYNRANFSQAGTVFTMTNDNTFYIGQILTVILR